MTTDAEKPVATIDVDDLPIPYIERTLATTSRSATATPTAGRTTTTFRSRRSRRPLAETRLALLTTAAPVRPEAGDQGRGAPYNSAAKFYQVYSLPVDPTPDLRISHLGYDRVHTAASDPNTWLPIARLREAVAAGRLGALAPRVCGVPTNRSQRRRSTSTHRPPSPSCVRAAPTRRCSSPTDPSAIRP